MSDKKDSSPTFSCQLYHTHYYSSQSKNCKTLNIYTTHYYSSQYKHCKTKVWIYYLLLLFYSVQALLNHGQKHTTRNYPSHISLSYNDNQSMHMFLPTAPIRIWGLIPSALHNISASPETWEKVFCILLNFSTTHGIGDTWRYLT